MLTAALAALLALQSASGSPNVLSPPPASSGSRAVNPPSSTLPPPSAEAPAAEAPGEPRSAGQPTGQPAPAATPMPVARGGVPIPGPRPTGDRLLVVNKSDNSVSILDASTGRLRTTVEVEAGPHEVETFADGRLAA